MTWADARSRLKTDLEGIAAIETVYEYPPNVLNAADLPCAVIIPPAVDIDYSGGIRRSEYTVRVQLIHGEKNLDDALTNLATYHQSFIDAWDAERALEGNAVVLRGPSIDEPGDIDYAGRTPENLVGFTATFRIRVDEAKVAGA